MSWLRPAHTPMKIQYMMKYLQLLISLLVGMVSYAQTFNNPVLPFDYSDPDVCAVGKDYYLTASSFNCSPGLPILHSCDLVNWTIINYALDTVPNAYCHDGKVAHGKAVWAPSIRYHKGMYYILWGDPDIGIFMVSTTDPTSRWSDPVTIIPGKGFIDPCPLWDDDGKLYVAYALAASRANTNSVIFIQQLNPQDWRKKGMPILAYDGTYDDSQMALTKAVNHTIEGPKLYKHNGFYYIFAPAGGVDKGWQLALRSKNVFGPYESKVVMMQGTTNINGPHQGGWVETPSGESWFMHFQEKQPFGRVVHLNPVKWVDNWPVVGNDPEGKGWGEPLASCNMPNAQKSDLKIQMNDEFDSTQLGLQWQWQANYEPWFGSTSNLGFMRIYSCILGEQVNNMFDVPNMLLQKIPSTGCVATANVKIVAKDEQCRSGIVVMGLDYAALLIQKRGNKLCLALATCINAEEGNGERVDIITDFKPDKSYNTGATSNAELNIQLRVKIDSNGKCQFAYSTDGKRFREIAKTFQAREGKWIGAKMGLFSMTTSQTTRGWIDCDWFHVEM